MLLATLVTLPLVLLNVTGAGLDDVAGEPGAIALTSVGNFLSSSDGTISLSRIGISAADISFYLGVLDA
eukprot:Skav201861  [mRNA]  locus=scaffold3490:110066:111289:- [translate_table: standard]